MELVIDNQEKTPQGALKKAPLMGAVKPRVMSIPLKGKSRGDEFAAFAESIGYTLDPWQKYIADDFLTMDEGGEFIRKTIMVCVSRQNGKTLLAALESLLASLYLGKNQSSPCPLIDQWPSQHLGRL
jgi:hypothetical protein